MTDDLSLPVLARKAGMSERSFSRHYAEATGLTPARAVERLRVEAARRLLSDTRLPVKRIAAALRLRIRGNTAPKLPAPVGCDAAGLPSEIQLLRPLRVKFRRTGPSGRVRLAAPPETERTEVHRNFAPFKPDRCELR